jgi:hypothetical protein
VTHDDAYNAARDAANDAYDAACKAVPAPESEVNP